MPEKYGIKAKVLEADALTPVSTETCVVYFGGAYNSAVKSMEPVYINSYEEYVDTFHAGTEPAGHLTLDDCAEFALNEINGAWFVNCLSVAGTSEPLASAIKGALEPALAWICLNSSDVPNIICIPKQQDAELLAVLAAQCGGGINNTMHAQGFIDCLQDSSTQLSLGNPVAAAIEAPSTNGSLISCWGDAILERNSNGTVKKHIPASIVMSAVRAAQDAKNTNNVPYRSVGNLRVDIKGVYVENTECTCRQDKMNTVVENGIVSFVNRGNNRWFTWGDHTSAVTLGTVEDETYRFDSTVAVLYHILNRFILKWGGVIDSPMSLMLRDCILDEEQTYLNGLKAMGCLVGEPRCEFRPVDNSLDTLGKGQFYFTNIATVVPPAKYIELGIQYTDAGLTAYLEG